MKKNIVIVILIILLVSVSGYLVYDKFIVEDNQLIDNNTKVENDNNTEVESDNNIEKNNDYILFANNLKSQFSKFDSNNHMSQFFNSELISDGYEVYLDEERNLYINYFNDKLNKKYGEYLITSNVLYFNVVSTGQGGGNTLFFINEDGTVGSAEIEYGVHNDESKPDVTKDLGYKDIVAIVGGVFGDGYTGASGPIFIDINGNIYSRNLK